MRIGKNCRNHINIMYSFFTKEDADLERDLFERAPVPTAYMKLAVPVVLSMVLGVVYNMVDT